MSGDFEKSLINISKRLAQIDDFEGVGQIVSDIYDSQYGKLCPTANREVSHSQIDDYSSMVNIKCDSVLQMSENGRQFSPLAKDYYDQINLHSNKVTTMIDGQSYIPSKIYSAQRAIGKSDFELILKTMDGSTISDIMCRQLKKKCKRQSECSDNTFICKK